MTNPYPPKFKPNARDHLDLTGMTTRLRSQRHGKVPYQEVPEWLNRSKTFDRLSKVGILFSWPAITAFMWRLESPDPNYRYWNNFYHETVRIPDLQRKYKEYAKLDPVVASNRQIYDIRQAVSVVGAIVGAVFWAPSRIPPFTFWRKRGWMRKYVGVFYGYCCTRMAFTVICNKMYPPEDRMESNERFGRWMRDNDDVDLTYRPAIFRKRLMERGVG